MKKILVIEDELLLREGVSEILTFEGFDVFKAENGEIGILAVFQYAPDLILCDIMMPLMDGYEVLNQLRQNEKTKLIPFIFMTALTERSNQRLGMELGSDDYITKPYTREELLKAISTRLKKSGDIKEREESSLNELRENIISHLPHELRTPLNGMLSFGQQLMDYPETVSYNDLSEIGKNIYGSALRLSRLIQNYLIYTQLELKKSDPLQMTELKSLKKICQKIAEEVAVSYDRLNDLNLNTTDGVSSIGETEFIKIVEELTDNAFKFSATGTKVTVSCGMGNGQFYLTVEDHGRGIAASDIHKIGAYMQFDRKLYEQQGSGLGLIISKKIVALYEGKLSIESIPEKGTIIRVILPGKICY